MRIYVSTYRKYSEGSLQGEWLDLEDYDSYEEFMEACRELHADEKDPEFMFQDADNVPDWAWNESGVSKHLWGYLELDEEDRAKFNFLVEHRGEDVEDAFGKIIDVIFYEGMSLAEVAEELVDEGIYGKVSESLKYYIDFEKLGNDLSYDDYYETSEGVFFYNG
jgi:antirestriction protein